MRLLLNGGGSTEQLIPTMNKLNEIIDHNKPILYVPLAMDEVEHPYDGCYEWFSKQITNVVVPSLDMTRSFEDLASKNLNKYSAIFIGGGNTYKLLKGLKESGAFDKIQEYIQNNGIVIGCSAGAVVCGKDIDIIASMDPNDVKLTDTKGFDVLSGISVFPHYINLKSKLTDEENQARIDKFTNSIIEFTLKNGDVYAIPEEDTIYINGTDVEIIGTRNYFYFKEGVKQEFELGNSYNKKYTYDAETKKWIIEDLNTTNSVDNYMKKIADEYEPRELIEEEKELFDKENLYRADYFKDRKKYENNNLENVPICPHCKNKLSFMMPDGKTLYCNNCKKYFVNNDGVAGKETGSPYMRKDVLY